MKYIKIVFSAWLLLMIAPIVSKAEEQNTPNLRMAIISDTHIGAAGNDDLLRSVLQDYETTAPGYDVLSVVGDLTTRGLAFEYDLFNRIIRDEVNPNVEKVMTMGNHEFFEMRYSSHLGLSDDDMKNRFVNNMKQYGPIKNVYYDRWVNGYHFIALGGEAVHPTNWDIPIISNEQYDWLEETIREDAENGKPIFVFLHQPIDNTIYCSEEWGARFTDDRLKEILQQYPQTFLFSGHTHCLVEHPRNVYQDGFTMVGTGSVTKLRYHEGGVASTQKSDGLFVNVYDDRVEINGRDFDALQWTSSHTVRLPYEELEVITDTEAPTFYADSLFMIERQDIETIELTWDAAFDNTQVDKYIIRQNGENIKTVYVDYWNEESATRQYKEKIANLSFDTDYDYEIIAVDAWGNESLPLQAKLTSISETGWVGIKSTWYYIDSDTGKLVTRWKYLDDEWYFFNKDAMMRTGWLKEGPVNYYLTADGTLSKGWSFIDHQWYHFSSRTGVMTTGWFEEKNKKYYLNEDGVMAKGWNLIQDKWYYMDDYGAMTTGWVLINGKWYYLNDNGTMETGWLSIGSLQYYLFDSGQMATGWLQESGQWYFMKSSGAMSKGWISNNGKWYYFDSNGKMAMGWTKVNGLWYYLNSSGDMATGWQFVNGNWYYLNHNGSMQTGWNKLNNQWYYLKQDGAMQTGWLKLGTKWYYLLSDGQMSIGWMNLDNTWYYLDSNGVWIEDTLIE